MKQMQGKGTEYRTTSLIIVSVHASLQFCNPPFYDGDRFVGNLNLRLIKAIHDQLFPSMTNHEAVEEIILKKFCKAAYRRLRKESVTC